jgi:polyisoprenoid-binding protein YceI
MKRTFVLKLQRKRKMATTNWTLDPSHSEIGFKVRHMMISNVSGAFTRFAATLETEGEDFTTSKVSFTAETGSVFTGSDQRDGHIKSPDFFDSENFPLMTFTGTKIEKVSATEFVLHGDLSIRGKSKPVKFDVECSGIQKDPWGNRRAGFTITGKIKRSDWNLVWNVGLEAGGVLVSEEVRIQAEVQFTKSA